MKCSQCDRPAIVAITNEKGEGGCPLCVRCNLMHEQAEMLLFFRQASVANQLQAGLDDTFGLPRSRRYQLPSVVLGSGGESVSTMNLNFQGCEIGFLDTGTI